LVARAKALKAAFKARLRCEKRRGDASSEELRITIKNPYRVYLDTI